MADATRKKSRKLSVRGNSRRSDISADNLFSSDASDLNTYYELILKAIESDDVTQYVHYLNSSDMKYFLIHNDMDYYLFRTAVKYQRTEFLQHLERIGYSFNKSMLLIELYDNYMNTKTNTENVASFNG